MIAGIGAVSLARPLVSARIFVKWFTFPEVLLRMLVPLIAGALGVLLWWVLRQMPLGGDQWNWLPCAMASSLFATAYLGLAYSFYPYVLPDLLTIYEAAAAPISLRIILIGACCVVPAIIGY